MTPAGCLHRRTIRNLSSRRSIVSKNQDSKPPTDKALDDELSEIDLNQVVGGKKVAPIDSE
jgi:hypothetical protein